MILYNKHVFLSVLCVWVCVHVCVRACVFVLIYIKIMAHLDPVWGMKQSQWVLRPCRVPPPLPGVGWVFLGLYTHTHTYTTCCLLYTSSFFFFSCNVHNMSQNEYISHLKNKDINKKKKKRYPARRQHSIPRTTYVHWGEGRGGRGGEAAIRDRESCGKRLQLRTTRDTTPSIQKHAQHRTRTETRRDEGRLVAKLEQTTGATGESHLNNSVCL